MSMIHENASNRKLLLNCLFTFPTEGKPIKATRASPLFNTSNPSPFSDFFDGSRSCDLYLANFAFRRPKWYSVAEKQAHLSIVGYVVFRSAITFIFLCPRYFLFYFRNFFQNSHVSFELYLYFIQ